MSINRLLAQIVLAFLLCGPSFAAYSFHRPITIDHTQVGSSDSTNFPLLVSGTYSYLATTGNGGNVTSSSGYDLIYTSDSGCSTLLNFERVSWSATTGAIQIWVKLPTVSHTADTLIYECYGNPAITTDQQNVTGTWDSAYRAVYHLQESGNPYLDSTSNGFNSTGGTYPTQTTGLFGNAQQFASASSKYIQFPDPMQGQGQHVSGTFSGWMKLTSAVLNVIYDNRVNAGVIGGVLYTDGSAHASDYFNNSGTVVGSANLNDGNWHYLVGIVTGAFNGTTVLYVDGVLIGTAATGVFGGYQGGSSAARIGASADASPLYANATIQEVRVSNTERSADWITAEYNNQKSGSILLTIGSASSNTPPAGGIILQ